MQKTFHSTIEATLNRFPEVRWDRWSGTIDHFVVFGWVTRDDGKFDFIEIIFIDGEADWVSTSSAKYSEEFGKRLGFEDHNPCKRVEWEFPGVNSIKLQPKKPEFPTDGSINPAYHDMSIANEGTDQPGKLPGWYRHYRGDKGVWEDICPHGVGHEKGIHGCDGCCAQLKDL